MSFANYADELQFMTVDRASRRLGQIADELDAREKALEARVTNLEERLQVAEDQIAACCSHAPVKSETASAAPVNPSSNNL